LKIIDKDFRLFGVVSIIDIAIVAVLIVFAFLARRFSAPQSAAARPGDVTIRYTVEVQHRNPGFKDNVKIGAKVADSLRGYEIGTITKIYAQPYLEDAPDFGSNTIKRASVDGLETAYIEIEAKAQVTDYTTLIGSFEVLVGKEIFIKTRDFAAGGYVVQLNRGEAS